VKFVFKIKTNEKKLVVLTGAGISAESGIKTFRDSDGLWEGHNVQDVTTRRLEQTEIVKTKTAQKRPI
jgi:NAD-dependent SIR2 family protein deacetylase